MIQLHLIHSYIIPNWFVGFDIIMELLFAIVAITVSIFAYKIYKISKEKGVKLFSVGFLFIGLSYITHALINFFIVSEMAKGTREVIVENLQTTAFLSVVLFMALFTIGLITIFYANNKTNKKENYFLLIILGLLSVFTNISYIAAFYITSTFILIFINFHYAKDYIQNKNHKTLLVFISFIFLLLSTLVFVFPVTYEEYVIAHFLELVAYVLILVSLIRTIKIKPKLKRNIP